MSKQALARISIEQGEWCTFCGQRAADTHHVTRRSRGGKDGPTVPVCRDCHRRIDQGDWESEYDAENRVLSVLGPEGVIWERAVPPDDFDPSSVFQALQGVQAVLVEVDRCLPWLDTEALEAAYLAMAALVDSRQAAQAELLAIARKRIIKGARAGVAAFAQRLGIGRSTAYQRLRVYDAFHGGHIWAETLRGEGRSWWLLETCAQTESPLKTLEQWDDAKEEQPNLTTQEFRLMLALPKGEAETFCPHCGEAVRASELRKSKTQTGPPSDDQS